MALAAASWSELSVLNCNPNRGDIAAGKFDQVLIFEKLYVNSSDEICEEVSNALNALHRHTSLATPVVELQSTVAAEATVNDRLHDCPPKLMAKSAVPEEAGVPVMV